MQGELPMYECPEDALKAAVAALGGAKAVGAKLYPDKTPDAAARLLLDCLNPSRAEKLDLSQVLMILRLARDSGHHSPMQWIAGEIGYEARAVTRAEEADRLTTVVEQSAKTLAAALATLERLQRVRAA